MCIQELYIGGDVLTHSAYDIRWETVEQRKEQREAIGIAVSPRGRFLVEARTDIIEHSYVMAIDV